METMRQEIAALREAPAAKASAVVEPPPAPAKPTNDVKELSAQMGNLIGTMSDLATRMSMLDGDVRGLKTLTTTHGISAPKAEVAFNKVKPLERQVTDLTLKLASEQMKEKAKDAKLARLERGLAVMFEIGQDRYAILIHL